MKDQSVKTFRCSGHLNKRIMIKGPVIFHVHSLHKAEAIALLTEVLKSLLTRLQANHCIVIMVCLDIYCIVENFRTEHGRSG